MSCTLWLHCNKCFLEYKQENQYCFTKCGHVLCAKCAKFMGRDQRCAVCKTETSYIPLTKDIPSTVMSYFSGTESQLMQYNRITQFQNSNRDELIRHLRGKYNKAKSQYFTLLDHYKKVKAELDRLTKPRSPPSMFGNSTSSRSNLGGSSIDQSGFQSCQSIPNTRHVPEMFPRSKKFPTGRNLSNGSGTRSNLSSNGSVLTLGQMFSANAKF